MCFRGPLLVGVGVLIIFALQSVFLVGGFKACMLGFVYIGVCRGCLLHWGWITWFVCLGFSVDFGVCCCLILVYCCFRALLWVTNLLRILRGGFNVL